MRPRPGCTRPNPKAAVADATVTRRSTDLGTPRPSHCCRPLATRCQGALAAAKHLPYIWAQQRARQRKRAAMTWQRARRWAPTPDAFVTRGASSVLPLTRAMQHAPRASSTAARRKHVCPVRPSQSSLGTACRMPSQTAGRLPRPGPPSHSCVRQCHMGTTERRRRSVSKIEAGRLTGMWPGRDAGQLMHPQTEHREPWKSRTTKRGGVLALVMERE
jgi:hypothetical protein